MGEMFVSCMGVNRYGANTSFLKHGSSSLKFFLRHGRCASIENHPFDACLNDRARTTSTRCVGDIDDAILGLDTGTGREGDKVRFRVAGEQILGRTNETVWRVCNTLGRSAIWSG